MNNSVIQSIASKENRDKLEKAVEAALSFAKKNGATSAEVGSTIETGLSVTVRMGSLETVEYNCDEGVGITVYFDNQKGSANSTDMSLNSIKETVNAACQIAKAVSSDEFSGLADKEFLAYNYLDLDLFHEWNITPEDAIRKGIECEEIARSLDKRIINSEGTTISTNQSYRCYGNSHGFIGIYPKTRHDISSVLVAKENNLMQRDYYYSGACAPTDLESIDYIANQVALRTLNRLGAQSISTRTSPIVFRSDIARSLISCFVSAVSGYKLYKKSTFLLDSLNKQVFPNFMSIVERPHIKKAIGSAPFDSEGVVTKEREIITNGKLQSYLLDSYSARRLGLNTTGHASDVHNLCVKPNDLSFNELLLSMGDGLLVTELLGHGINIVTGDFSQGAAGFWVENGIIKFPVEEVTIAGNLKNMFLNIVAISNDIDKNSNILTGSILVNNMTIAGQ